MENSLWSTKLPGSPTTIYILQASQTFRTSPEEGREIHRLMCKIEKKERRGVIGFKVLRGGGGDKFKQHEEEEKTGAATSSVADTDHHCYHAGRSPS
ncbi:unnamed protein product [Prunus armeniaca]|nr:hypothetical protein GBA52_008666 [Prunus armeniaca]